LKQRKIEKQWNTAKTILIGKVISITAYIKKWKDLKKTISFTREGTSKTRTNKLK
jgi:hypothetical protein